MIKIITAQTILKYIKSPDRELRDLAYKIIMDGNLKFNNEVNRAITLILIKRIEKVEFDNTKEYIEIINILKTIN